MLVGVSALTTIGLRRYYDEAGDIPPPLQVCGGTTRCDAFDHLLREAGIAQEQTVFAGAAVCALVAGAAALVLFRSAETRRTTLAPVGGTVDGGVTHPEATTSRTCWPRTRRTPRPSTRVASTAWRTRASPS